VTSLPQRRPAAPDLPGPNPHEAPLSVIAFDLLTATPRERDVYACGEFWGTVRGIDIGRRQREAEIDAAEQAAWVQMREFIKALNRSVPYSELCEIRGEPERAERAREHERRIARGQDAPPLWPEHPAHQGLP
jgi:hypothetical protein